jgi:hypothetical protein
MFILATVLLVVMGLMHVIAQLGSRAADPAGIAIETSMRRLHVSFGFGMSPSLLDLSDNLGVSVSLALLWLGVLNLVVASAASPRLLRRTTLVNLVGGAALAGSQLHYHVAPPLVMLALIEATLVISLVRQATDPTATLPRSGVA